MWSRTVVGRHCYAVGSWRKECDEESSVNCWLEKLSKRNSFKEFRSEKNSEPQISNRTDPFQVFINFIFNMHL